MGIGKDPAGQINTNIIDEIIKAFGDIPADFTLLINLDTNYTRTHLMIVNSLNEDIKLQFESNEITIQASKDFWFDGFKHNGEIKYKHNGTAPTAGKIQLVSY